MGVGVAVQHAEALHTTACAKIEALKSQRDRYAEELQRAQWQEQEAANRLKRLSLAEAAPRLADAEAHLTWLDDIATSVAKATSKRGFAPDVMEDLRNAASLLRRCAATQRYHADEARAAVQKQQAATDTALRELAHLEQRKDEASSALTRAQQEVQDGQLMTDHLLRKAMQARNAALLEQEVSQLHSRVDQTRAATFEAARHHHAVRQHRADFGNWTEDLGAFFEGRAVRDGNAILAGLQTLSKADDPLPMIMQTMLMAGRSVDVGAKTVVSVREGLKDQLRREGERLGHEVATRAAGLREAEQAQREAESLLFQQQQQLDAEHPRGSARLDAIATPLRSDEVFRRVGAAGPGGSQSAYVTHGAGPIRAVLMAGRM